MNFCMVRAITFIRRDLVSMSQKNLCGNNICAARASLNTHHEISMQLS
jgi:hypothetical protein